MNRCEDCLHFDLCEAMEESKRVKKIKPGDCYFFKHKQNYIKLPCKIGDTVWVISKNVAEPFPAKFRLDDLEQIGRRIFLTRAEAMKRMGRIR